jgi:hypothetical protein
MKCCIAGTVRNCDKYLSKILNSMEQIGSLFEDYVIILYYDKSTDRTLHILKEYQLNHPKLILLINDKPLLQYRTHRIALGRNKCLEIMRNEYSTYEYFIMMDCDDRCAYNIKLKLLNAYLLRNDWDSLSFNHPSGYYDCWALSIRPYMLSCHHFANPSNGMRLINNLIKKTPNYGLIKCWSAFNGFAIYRTSKFVNCVYNGAFNLDYIPTKLIKENILCSGSISLKQNKEDCEHRFFHITAILKNNARIRISPLCLFI